MDLLRPACEQIAIAGSLRRKKPDVGDIELLCVPHQAGNSFFTDALDEVIRGDLRRLLAVRPNIKGGFSYGPKNKLMVHTRSGISVDIFSTESRYWGLAFVVRTGSVEFNKRMMTRFLQLHMRGHAYAGVTSSSGEEIACPDEETVFRLLGWRYIPPEDRF